MLRALRIPIGWSELVKRTVAEVMADNCLGLAAQLAYYFFLALFPALLFLVALISYIPVDNLMDSITAMLGRVAPSEALKLIQDQIIKVAQSDAGGLLTLGMIGTLWSTSSGVTAIIDTLNTAYDIQESRPWWKVRLVALGLTVALAVFIVLSTTLVIAGPTLAEKAAAALNMGPAFEWSWKLLQWPLVFGLVSLAIAMVFYFAPDAEQDWIWITPGSILATLLWLLASIGFRFYVTNFGSYNATYGAIGGVIVLLLWMYVSAFAILVGAELNAEIEHASPYGKDPGEKAAGEKKQIGALAERTWEEQRREGTFRPALSPENCVIDRELPQAVQQPRRVRPSDLVVGGLVIGQAAAIAYARMRAYFKRTEA
jgi:membrane protein